MKTKRPNEKGHCATERRTMANHVEPLHYPTTGTHWRIPFPQELFPVLLYSKVYEKYEEKT